MTSSPASAKLQSDFNKMFSGGAAPATKRSDSTETLIRRAKTFLFVFDSFATDTAEVAAHTGVGSLTASRDLKALEAKGLVVQDDTNDEAQGSARRGAYKTLTWQAQDTYDYVSRAEASASFAKAFGTGAIALAETSAVDADSLPGVKTKKAATTATKETKMATVKTKAKTGAKTSAAKTASTPKTTAPKAESTRRTAEDVDALVPAFLEHVQGGGTLRDLKKEHGFSDDGPIRAAMFRAGYTSKGVELTDDEASPIAAKGAALAKRLVKEREAGVAWYALAHRTGLTEPEVKKIVADAGGPTGRVYREPAPKAPKAKTAAGKAKAKTAAAKAKEAAADPS